MTLTPMKPDNESLPVCSNKDLSVLSCLALSCEFYSGNNRKNKSSKVVILLTYSGHVAFIGDRQKHSQCFVYFKTHLCDERATNAQT